MQKGSMVHDNWQVKNKGDPKKEPKSRPTKDKEEIASQILRMNDVDNMKAEVRFDGSMWGKLSSLLAKEQRPWIRPMS